MPVKPRSYDVLLVRISDELFTPYLEKLCRANGWKMRHRMNANKHWINIPRGTGSRALSILRPIAWVLDARRDTKLRLL